MNDLQIIIEGTSKVHDIDIPNIYGGFGKDDNGNKRKAITDKYIAELHDIEAFKVRERINNNIKQFEFGIDLIDLKVIRLEDDNLELLKSLGYTNMQISKAKSIYLLSERGYLKLIKIMDTQLAWDIYNEMLNDYFYYRQKEEIVINCEALDRIKNGFNYKEIEYYIDNNPDAIASFKLKEFIPWVPSERYPKQLVKIVLKTTDYEIDKTLKDFSNKTAATKKKDNIKLLLENNNIPYREIPNNFIIFDKKYSNSSMTLYTEEEVVNIILTIQHNEIAQKIRNDLIQQGLIDLIPINNVTLTEKEKELTAKCEELEDTISDLKHELKASIETTENLNNTIKSLNNTIKNLEKDKQSAYEKGIEEGKKQVKKERTKNLFNNIKESVKRGKKWIENKLGGEKTQAEIKEYPNTDSNRIKPKSNPETEKIGRFIHTEESEDDKKNRLRKEVGTLVHRVANLKSKQVKIIWKNLHCTISNEFRNGNYIGKSINPDNPNSKPSIINSYTLEELEFAIEYLTEIINKKAIS